MWKWIFVVLAIAGAVSAVSLAQKSVQPPPVPPPIAEPTRNPFASGIAGSGLVEASSENVVIGVPEPGLVTKIYVIEGQRVKKGEPLFETDSRALKSQLLTARTSLASADANLQRVKAYRRQEEEGPLRAQLATAQATYEEAKRGIAAAEAAVAESEWARKDNEAKIRRLEVTVRANASTEEELERVRYLLWAAEARVATAKQNVNVARAHESVARSGIEQAQASLNIFLAGAWKADISVAEAAVQEAQSRIEQINMDIERHTIRAPLDASVLRLSLREGEYATAVSSQAESGLLVLGDMNTRNVRVDIDEFDARRFQPGAKAIAFYKGGGDTQIPMEFVRVDPFVIPKRALTNSQRELVDTRVLEMIYKIADPKMNVYAGQQLDVYIESSAAQ